MIAATLGLSDATRKVWDVIVVGAGPAGSLAARETARRGRSVLLVDRAAFPRGKVCGCCLNGNAFGTLQSVGLGDLPARRGAVPLCRIQLGAGKQVARLVLPRAMALSREVFDAALVEAAIDAGAAFLPQTRGEWLGFEDDVRLTAYQADQDLQLRISQNEAQIIVGTRLAVAADGLSGTFLEHGPPVPGSRIGTGLVTGDAPAYYEPGTIYMACGRNGYLGLVRLEDGRLDLAAALDARWMREAGGPGAAANQLLESVGWPAPDNLAHQPWRGTTALTRTASQVASMDRVFRIGDAAGYIEPFTGEGMAWALAAAVAVVPLAERAAVAWQPSLEREWEQTYRRVVGRRQWTCHAAAAVLRRPWLTRACVGVLSCWPRLAGPVIYHLNDRTTRFAC